MSCRCDQILQSLLTVAMLGWFLHKDDMQLLKHSSFTKKKKNVSNAFIANTAPKNKKIENPVEGKLDISNEKKVTTLENADM